MRSFKTTVSIIIVLIASLSLVKGETDDEMADNLYYTLYIGTNISEYIGIPIKNGTDLFKHPVWDKNKLTIFIAGGWTNELETPESVVVIASYLELKDQYNVVQLNYTKYDTIMPSFVAFVKTVQVGVVFGNNMQWLVDNGLNPSKVHLMGTSLGGQLVGQIARHVKIELLIGLDPAGPFFNHLLPNIKKGFANYTMILHDDRYRNGMSDISRGDIDILFNDGTAIQPACPDLAYPLICSHIQVLSYWASILLHPDLFIATKCSYIASCRLGCNLTDLVTLSPDTRAYGTYYIKTSGEKPYGLGKDGYINANKEGVFPPFCKEK